MSSNKNENEVETFHENPFDGERGIGTAESNHEIHEASPPDIESSTDNPNPESLPVFSTVAAQTPPPPFSSPTPETQLTTNQQDDVPDMPPRPRDQESNDLPERESEDPQISALRAMFPDFDSAVLQSVLESVGGNQDRAIDMLLGMSDPDYVPQEPPARPEPSQTELDEQFARRLMLEEQQAAGQHQQGYNPQQEYNGYQGPYQPRVRGRGAQQQQQPGAGANAYPNGQRDTVADFQESFNKIAETGKKTFSSIVTKVKAKMQEYDQSRQGQGQSSNYGGTQPTWTGGGQQANTYGQQQQAQSYYDPNAPPNRSPPAISASTRPVQGYDTTPKDTYRTSTSPEDPIHTDDMYSSGKTAINAHSTGGSDTYFTSPYTPPSNDGGGNPSSLLASSPPRDVARPPSTSSGAPPNLIDRGKLGLLPKRPVSLLRPDPQAQVHPQPRHDDDDELDYAENPFDDEHK